MDEQFSGTKAEIASKFEQVVQAIVPEAKCRVEDCQDKVTCWVDDVLGIRRQFTAVLDGLDQAKLEALSRGLLLEHGD